MSALVNFLSPRPSLSNTSERPTKRSESKIKRKWPFSKYNQARALRTQPIEAGTEVTSRPTVSRTLSAAPHDVSFDINGVQTTLRSPPVGLPHSHSAPVIQRPLPPLRKGFPASLPVDASLDTHSIIVDVGSLKSRHSTILPTPNGHTALIYDKACIPETSLLKTGLIDSQGQAFLDFMRADRALGEAVNAVERYSHSKITTPTQSPLQQTAPAVPLRRRYTSMLTRSTSTQAVSALHRPGLVQRRAWMNSIFQPSPQLPSRSEEDTGTEDYQQQDDESALVAMQNTAALRQALEDVHAAQGELLSTLATWTETQPLSERLLNFAQAISCRKLSEQLENELHLREGSLALEVLSKAAGRLCDTLEDVREGCRRLLRRQESARVETCLPTSSSAPQIYKRTRKVSEWGSSSSNKRQSIDITFPSTYDFPSMRSPSPQDDLFQGRRAVRAEPGKVVIAAMTAFEDAKREFMSTLASVYKAASEQSRSIQALEQQSLLHKLCASQGLPNHAYRTLPGSLSTFTIICDTLDDAISSNFIDESEAAALDPSLFLTVPRLAVVQGIVSMQMPTSVEVVKLPFETLVPTLCQSLPIESVVAIRSLDEIDLQTFKGMLAGLEGPQKEWQISLFRSVCTTADQVSHGHGAEWAGLLQRALCKRETGLETSLDDLADNMLHKGNMPGHQH